MWSQPPPGEEDDNIIELTFRPSDVELVEYVLQLLRYGCATAETLKRILEDVDIHVATETLKRRILRRLIAMKTIVERAGIYCIGGDDGNQNRD